MVLQIECANSVSSTHAFYCSLEKHSRILFLAKADILLRSSTLGRRVRSSHGPGTEYREYFGTMWNDSWTFPTQTWSTGDKRERKGNEMVTGVERTFTGCVQ